MWTQQTILITTEHQRRRAAATTFCVVAAAAPAAAATTACCCPYMCPPSFCVRLPCHHPFHRVHQQPKPTVCSSSIISTAAAAGGGVSKLPLSETTVCIFARNSPMNEATAMTNPSPVSCAYGSPRVVIVWVRITLACSQNGHRSWLWHVVVL